MSDLRWVQFDVRDHHVKMVSITSTSLRINCEQERATNCEELLLIHLQSRLIDWNNDSFSLRRRSDNEINSTYLSIHPDWCDYGDNSYWRRLFVNQSNRIPENSSKAFSQKSPLPSTDLADYGLFKVFDTQQHHINNISVNVSIPNSVELIVSISLNHLTSHHKSVPIKSFSLLLGYS